MPLELEVPLVRNVAIKVSISDLSYGPRLSTGYETVTAILTAVSRACSSQPMSPADHLFQHDVLASCHFKLHRSGVPRQLSKHGANRSLATDKLWVLGVEITHLHFNHGNLSFSELT